MTTRTNAIFVTICLFFCLPATRAQVITTFAGAPASFFGGDGGPATAALINGVSAITSDASGNIYIADAGNNRIRKINTAGVISTFAGTGAPSGGDGGPASAAGLNNPSCIVFDLAGNMFIADVGNNRIRKINTSGIITTVAGTGVISYSGDGGPATDATMNGPGSVAVDGAGNLYIAETNNNCVRKVNTSGIITTIAGSTTGVGSFAGDGGPATDAYLNFPSGVALDAAGNIYISDGVNSRIRKIDLSGNISTVAGNGTLGYSGDGGPATDAAIYQPASVYFDATGNMYIPDVNNHLIRKVSTSGIITSIAGNGSGGYSGDGGAATLAKLNGPNGITMDGAGNFYIADRGNSKVRKMDPSGVISTYAGAASSLGDGGPATAAALNYPADIAFDSLGNVFIVEGAGARIRKVDPAGIITTIAGTGTAGFSGDGGPATNAAISGPTSIAMGPGGVIYFSDYGGNKRIRKIDAAGIITTVAGNGIPGYSGDGGPATASGTMIVGKYVAADRAGNLYLSESSSIPRIRKINTAGIITTIAGTGTFGFYGEGIPATDAQFADLGSLDVDSVGNIYIAEDGSHVIRMINTAGIITTIAGVSGSPGSSGDGGPATAARLRYPFYVSSTPTGILFTGDVLTNKIRMIVPSGIITTVAGNGTAGYSGDGGLATAAQLNGAISARLNKYTGDLYIIDKNNSVIRKVTGLTIPTPPPTAVDPVTDPISTLFPNPADGRINIVCNNLITNITIINSIGQAVFCGEYNSRNVEINTAKLPTGNYSAIINSTEVKQFVKQ